MMNALEAIKVATSVKQYVEKEGKTLILSQGKMLKDQNMPEDLKAFLKTG